jgi:hypothetical protein
METTTPPPLKPIIVNPTPKTRFMAQPGSVIGGHRDMVSSPQFQVSTDHALLEYVRANCEMDTSNPQIALASFYRIQGAYEFLGCMRKLAEFTPVPVKAEGSTPDNLNHRV